MESEETTKQRSLLSKLNVYIYDGKRIFLDSPEYVCYINSFYFIRFKCTFFFTLILSSLLVPSTKPLPHSSPQDSTP